MRTNTTTRTLACAAGALVLGLPLIGTAAASADELDTTAPVSTVNVGTPPASGWYRSTVPLRFTADDAGGSGVTSIDYRIGDGPVVSTGVADVSITITDDGATTITLWSIDAAGNIEAPHDFTVRIDRGAPVITFATPTRVQQGESVPFEIDCADPISGIASCESNVADGEPLPTSELGVQGVVVSALDVAGNLTSTAFVYEVVPDLVGPEVSLAIAPEPASGWYASGLGIAVRAADPAGIASVHWVTDGAVSTNGDVVGEAEGLFDLTVEGVTEVSYWAYDTFGNRSADGHATVRIDTVAPDISFAPRAFAGGAVPEFELGSRARLPLGCTDETSGVAECGVEGLPSLELPTGTLGDHSVTAFAVDVAGNRTEVSYDYRVVAAAGGGDGDGGAGDGGDGDGPDGGPVVRPTGSGTPTLAYTGADVSGLVLVAGLLVGAGTAAIGGRRLLAR